MLAQLKHLNFGLRQDRRHNIYRLKTIGHLAKMTKSVVVLITEFKLIKIPLLPNRAGTIMEMKNKNLSRMTESLWNVRGKHGEFFGTGVLNVSGLSRDGRFSRF